MMKNPKKSEFLPRSDLGRNGVRFAFFGTSHIAVFVLEELRNARLMPSLIITPHDKPKGRGLALQPSPIKVWAQNNNVEVLQPERLDSEFSELLRTAYYELLTVFVVVDYGKILPKEVLAIPQRGVLNVHPSLLPRLRGPSPIRSAILNDEKETGVSVILVDEETDHGPIVAQKRITVPNWSHPPKPGKGGPPHLAELEEALMREGGKLLAQILQQWVAGKIDAHGQNHDIATYSEKIEKEDGLLNLSEDAYKNLLKIRAYEGWPGTYAYFERPSTGSISSLQAGSGQDKKKIRVGILDAHIENSALVIDRVKPEGKKEMAYETFLCSGARPISPSTTIG